MQDQDLSGEWRAIEADDDLRRRYPDASYDDSRWHPMAVPGHWRSHPAFATSDGPLLYRHRFDLADRPDVAPIAERRSWLRFDGIFYNADVWLDGTYLGDTEGYFFGHTLEVTEQLAAATEHVLALEVGSTPQHERTAKRTLTGVFAHGEPIPSVRNPGGVWRAVRIEHSGPVRIRHLRVRCASCTDQRAVVALRAVLDVASGDTTNPEVTVRTTVGDTDHEHTVSVAAGENRVEWEVHLDEPQRWWPWSLGDQTLHDVDVEVHTSAGQLSDRRHRRIGLRSVTWRNWIAQVNGERLFLKGVNVSPARAALAEADDDLLRSDVALARSAGLDLLHVAGHVSRPELYDAADEAGMLIWQDMPLQWGYARSVRFEARRQARELVDLLGHHASIFAWCAHNQPFAIDPTPEALGDPAIRRRLVTRAVLGQVLPTWNKSVLDRSVARTLHRSDDSRPVVSHSGVLPTPFAPQGTDTHLGLGWCAGSERGLETLLRRWPRLGRFVGAFGAQAVPDDADFLEPDDWPALDWRRAAHDHGLMLEAFERYVPPDQHRSFASWRDATQRYQAEVLAHHIVTLRRLKYRPCGGFAFSSFADGAEAVSTAVLDHRRQPKAGYATVQAACAPVIVTADRLPAQVQAGEHLALAVHVVSDLHWALDEAVVHAIARVGDEVLTEKRWAGEVGADSVIYVGTLDVDVPPAQEDLRVELSLRAGEVTATASDRTTIAR